MLSDLGFQFKLISNKDFSIAQNFWAKDLHSNFQEGEILGYRQKMQKVRVIFHKI